MTIDRLLGRLGACTEARVWASGKSWGEIYNTCHRGDWLLWLFVRTNPDSKRELTLAKAHCADTVRHLMRDERSRNAVDVAIAYGEGKATDKELADAAYAAGAAYTAAAAAAAYAAYAAAAAVDAAYAAMEQNQKLTADICRKYLPIEIWDIKE